MTHLAAPAAAGLLVAATYLTARHPAIAGQIAVAAGLWVLASVLCSAALVGVALIRGRGR